MEEFDLSNPPTIIFEEEQEIIHEVIEEPIKVYVKVNTNNEIIAVGSSMFIKDLTDWIYIDEGFGDKYAHAQSQYFDKPLMNEDGSYNYKLVGNKAIENL